MIDETNDNNLGVSFGVIAHPFSWSYPWFSHWDGASGYSGMELINGGEYLFGNPFGISQSIVKWDELLKNGLGNTLSSGKFACGTSNSDIHFGLHTFGQTVTYLYLPSQDGFSSGAVQEARRGGRAIASTDGSVAYFTLNGAHIGDVVTVSSRDPIEIKVHAKAVDRKRVRKIRLVSSYAEPMKFPAHGRDYQRTITIDKTKQSDYPYPSSSCYFRVEVDFAYRGNIYTCYTNPIWVKMGGQNVLVNSSFETGDTSGWKVVNLRNATSSVVSGNAADGSYCYGIYHTSAVGWYVSDWSSIGQNINGIIEPDTPYRVGFYYRTTDSYPFRIATTDTSLMMHSTPIVTVSNPIADGQWHYVSATFSRSPAELNYEPYLAFFYDYSTPGTVYVDCITCSAGP
ncbi:MAG: carbohydrate binding domain-containing protein [Actinomycetota bacterium]|nr:carbohydrate binding domain-containing protein [Actinomycetota bacterium]